MKSLPFALRSKPPVLRSESADEHTSLHKKLVEEIRPQGAIEAVYVEEITDLIWEIKRLRRCKVSVIHQMLRRALGNILLQVLPISEKIKAEPLSNRWFEGAAAKELVTCSGSLACMSDTGYRKRLRRGY
jgi:hypothetical protein